MHAGKEGEDKSGREERRKEGRERGKEGRREGRMRDGKGGNGEKVRETGRQVKTITG